MQVVVLSYVNIAWYMYYVISVIAKICKYREFYDKHHFI
jgi:predicted nucleic-acid-binding Zn-ribbon protein